MDFEDEDKPKYVSKTRRFAPGRARKSKPEPTPVHSSETDAPSESVRVNPSTSEVELDLSMDVNSTNYDSKSASELHMTKQTLTTAWKPPPTLDYAVGVLSGDTLHLNPVHAVPQLRPSMKYLSSKRIQAEAPEESARASKKQNKGVSKDQKPVPEENWVSLKYHGLGSEFHSRYLTKMMARTLISTHCAVGKAAETPEGFTLRSLSPVFYMFITKVYVQVSDSLRCLCSIIKHTSLRGVLQPLIELFLSHCFVHVPIRHPLEASAFLSEGMMHTEVLAMLGNERAAEAFKKLQNAYEKIIWKLCSSMGRLPNLLCNNVTSFICS
ncbi:hypothetical protein YC2023_025609 [Brassica napus]